MKKKQELKEVLPYIQLLINIGILMLITILGGFLLGLLIGRTLGFPVISLITFTIAGIISGFWLVYLQCLKKLQ